MFYNNQFVLVRGELQGRQAFYAHEVHARTKPESNIRFEVYNGTGPVPESAQGQTRKVVVCAGPYAPPTGVPSEGIKLLINKVREEKPHSVILLGPFIDEENEMAKRGVFSDEKGKLLTIEEFQELLLKTIVKEFANMEIPVCFGPSTRDLGVISPLPQDTFDIDQMSRDQLLTNPGFIRVNNQFSMAFVNTDYAKEAICGTYFCSKEGNNFDAILSEIVHQKSLVPIFPSNIPVDYSQISSLDIENDDHFSIHISPSLMTEYARVKKPSLTFLAKSFVVPLGHRWEVVY